MKVVYVRSERGIVPARVERQDPHTPEEWDEALCRLALKLRSLNDRDKDKARR